MCFLSFLEPEAKRKSKWDQRGVMPPLLLPYQPSSSSSSSSGVLPPFTTSASGTKSTVINAFGNINTRKKQCVRHFNLNNVFCMKTLHLYLKTEQLVQVSNGVVAFLMENHCVNFSIFSPTNQTRQTIRPYIDFLQFV